MAHDDEQRAEVMGALHAFLHSEDWSEARMVYIQNEELLSLPIVETILLETINREENEKAKANYQAHLDRIRTAKTEGVAAAFRRDISELYEGLPDEMKDPVIIRKLAMRVMAEMYRENGEAMMRGSMKNFGLPDEVIEMLIREIKDILDE